LALLGAEDWSLSFEVTKAYAANFFDLHRLQSKAQGSERVDAKDERKT
jgi:hypothetical protein